MRLVGNFLLGVVFWSLFVVGCWKFWDWVFEAKSHDVIKLTKKFGIFSPSTATKKPIIRIQSKNSTCTAFVIDSNYAITAAHCIDYEGKLPKHKILVSENGKKETFEVTAAGYDSNSDLGLIMGDFKDFQNLPVDFYKDDMIGNDGYMSCGYPRGDYVYICSPYVVKGSFYDDVDGYGRFFHGQSGGPVINLKTERVVAIVDAVTKETAIVVPLRGFFGVFSDLR